jgi:hypothetical protein
MMGWLVDGPGFKWALWISSALALVVVLVVVVMVGEGKVNWLYFPVGVPALNSDFGDIPKRLSGLRDVNHHTYSVVMLYTSLSAYV